MNRQYEIISSRNRRPMHVPFGAYESAETALRGDPSRFAVSLNGSWQYAVYSSPEKVPSDWASPSDLNSMPEMPVPSCWELHGVGKPVYVNIEYPFFRGEADRSFEIETVTGVFDLNAPHIPRENLTVCYYKSFTVPSDWEGRKLYLNFGGVETAFTLAVNGQTIGFSEDSKLDAEFDVTSAVHPGENLASVQVYRFSPQSYLEDQDYWHVHGIYRDVTLYSKSVQHIEDYQVQTVFGDTLNDAALRVRIWPDNAVPLHGEYSAKITLFDADGHIVVTHQTRSFIKYHFYLEPKCVVDEKISVPSPTLWNCEKPYLYTFVIEMLDPDGNTVDVESCRIGFREVRIKNGILELNRRRLIVRGANLHEFSPYTARAVSNDELLKQLLAMKALNFNAIRTCHYPKCTAFYDMCDELGLYVVDEANIETHGYDGTLSDSPRWADAYLQRGMRMCLRDKNHPSVIIWSLGNESGAGSNHAAMYGWLKHYDNRPVQLESGGSPIGSSDILAPMYPTWDWIEECMANTDDVRPFIMCEYAYAKSNSNGNFAEFWQTIRKYPRFQGGFVWDFIDKALVKPCGEKKPFRYSGAFGEDVVDPVTDMCLNGVVFADCEWKPGAFEVKNCQSPVYVDEKISRGISTGKVLHNEYFSSDLSEFDFFWELICNGSSVQNGKLSDIRVAPGKTTVLDIPYDRALVWGEAFVNLRIAHKEACAYAKAGDTVYSTQWKAEGSGVYFDSADLRSRLPLSVSETEELLTVSGADLELVYSKKDARFVCCTVNGNKLFADVKNELFRAPTGIDETRNSNSTLKDWKDTGLTSPTWVTESVHVQTLPTAVLIDESLSCCAEKIRLSRSYKITAKGIQLTTRLANGLEIETLARIGQSYLLSGEYSNLSWYGRGPHENYVDRKTSAHMGIYQSTVEAQHVNYVRPCECGGHEDVRWLTVTNASGHGMRISGNGFHFSALPWSVEQYAKAEYADELGESAGTTLSIDGFHAGLGGDTGWTRNIHPQYRLPAGHYLYEINIEWI